MPAIVVYTVREGDTLWNIAKNFGTTVNDIARYNGLSLIHILRRPLRC